VEAFLADETQLVLELPPLTTQQRYLVHKRCERADRTMTHLSVRDRLTVRRHPRIERQPGTDLRHKLTRALILNEREFSRYSQCLPPVSSSYV